MGEYAELAIDIEQSRIARSFGGRWINDIDEDGIPYDENSETLDGQNNWGAKHERSAQKVKNRARRTKEIQSLITQGYSVRQLTEYHFRINETLDIFPTAGKFHNLKTQERGVFRDIEKFLSQQMQATGFGKKKKSKSNLQHCFKHNGELPASEFKAPGSTWCKQCQNAI
jgi:hypothetical protein